MRPLAKRRARGANGTGPDPIPVSREIDDPRRVPDKLEPLVRQMLGLVGEDPGREGLRRTPLRVAKAWRELTSGYHADVDKIINQALFSVDYNEMVCVKDITFYSLC